MHYIENDWTKNFSRKELADKTNQLIDNLSSKYETEKDINARLVKDKIWNPLPFQDEKIDNNLSIEEIRE